MPAGRAPPGPVSQGPRVSPPPTPGLCPTLGWQCLLPSSLLQDGPLILFYMASRYIDLPAHSPSLQPLLSSTAIQRFTHLRMIMIRGKHNTEIKKIGSSPDCYGSVGWASSCKEKGCWFNSQPGHVPGFVGSVCRQEATV